MDFPNHIIVPTGSGGTVAGLLAGIILNDIKDCKIWSVAVCDNVKYFKDIVVDLFEKFNKRFNAKLTFPEGNDQFEIVDKYIGEGYGIPYKEEMVLMKKVASTEGVILDPVYTGKAFYGASELNKQGKFNKKNGKSKVLFIHTGGTFGMMSLDQIKNYYSYTKK